MVWQDKWNVQNNNNLHEIYYVVGKIICSYGTTRK